ncbi:hypothetical protein WISP_48108 [Willisornis vidua]|uniref:Uncharacterized protein n=1 Tax=Willisornis vidua TaxID=1566151 RepID=A0ABQ9DKZ1_9PASS|nr:hypothetical protein WISP_48108 [Willisornis vidua]
MDSSLSKSDHGSFALGSDLLYFSSSKRSEEQDDLSVQKHFQENFILVGTYSDHLEEYNEYIHMSTCNKSP